MDIHRKSLSSLCRLCGSKFKEREKKKLKSTVSRDIQQCLQVDVTGDQEAVHPPAICHSCTLKLSRWRKQKNNNRSALIPAIPLHDFAPHDDDCTVCEGRQWDPEIVLDMCRREGVMSWIFEDQLICVFHDNLGEIVLKRIVFGTDGRYLVFLLGKQVDVPDLAPKQLIQFVRELTVCTGINTFPSIAEQNREGLRGANGEITATVEEHFVMNGRVHHRRTIRYAKCDMIANTHSGLCSMCSFYKGTLHSKACHSKQTHDGTSKYKRNSYMTNEELHHKVSSAAYDNKLISQRNKALKKTVSQLFREESLELSPEDADKVSSLVAECSSDLDGILQSMGSQNCQLLWKEQCKAAETTPKQMRWHPAIIKWAIAIRSKSTSAYSVLRDSGFIRLPHPNTLDTYTHFTDPITGINPDLLTFFVNDLKLDDRPKYEREVNLIFDEMKVSSGLAFSMRTGRMVGFVDVGDVVGQMEEFERHCTDHGTERSPAQEKQTASHVLLFFARSLTSTYKFPVAYYATRNVCASELYPMAMECSKALHMMGLTVRTFTSDGASSNRRFYTILGSKTAEPGEPIYKSTNCFRPTESIYFICDVPHLLKTTRNNFENSGWNRSTKNLVFRGQSIKWSQLVQLFEWDQGLHRSAPGLRLLPRLTYEHLHLTPSLRMKVKLAAQVLSSSVANALESRKKKGVKGLESTILFVRNVNRAFDILNISNKNSWQRKRNVDLQPFSSSDDPRLEWLLRDFLGFLKEWREEGESKEALTKKEKLRLCLSRETLDGFYITVHSFVEATRRLLQMEGAQYVLSDKFNQDPVEEFFSKQRGTGGSQDNPTVDQFGHFMLANIVAGSRAVGSSRANVRLEEVCHDVRDEPLPKKKRTNTKTD